MLKNKEIRFTESHEWVAIEGKLGTVGITAHAQKELGEIVFVAFPKIGQKLKMGEEACILESTKAAADVYSPVSGKVVAVNEALKPKPDSLNQAPETEGWLFRIELSDPHEMDRLMRRTDYNNLLTR